MSDTVSSVRRTPALLVVALLLLAGCVGSPLGPNADADTTTPDAPATTNSTATATNGTATSANSTATTASTFVAGLSAGDRVPTDRVLATHRRIAVETGVVYRQNVTGQSAEDETPPVSMNRLGRVASDGPVVRQQYESTGGASPDSRSELWRNATVSLQRFGDGRFSVREANDTVPVAGTIGAEVAGFLRRGTFVVNRTTDDRVVLSATGTVDTESAGTGNEPRLSEYRGTVVLDRRGLVRSVDLRFSLTRSDTETSWRARHETTRIGSVTVERPSWWRTALDSLGTFSVTSGENYVRLTNDGDETYQSGTTVRLSESASGGTLATLDEPLAPGESVYLVQQGGVTVASRERPPDDRASLSGTYYVVVLDSEYREVFRTDVSL
jgi:hypothetical protein